MTKVYILYHMDNGMIVYDGALSNPIIATQFIDLNSHNYILPLPLNDPDLLNRIAKTNMKTNEPYKGAINIPCSACSAGDSKMEYHDHD